MLRHETPSRNRVSQPLWLPLYRERTPPGGRAAEAEHDVAQLLPTIRHLTERQYQLFFLFHSVIVRFKPAGLSRLVDSDVAEAAAAVAATLETSVRGVIYEHTPPGLPAQALATELTTTLTQIREQGAHHLRSRSRSGPSDYREGRTPGSGLAGPRRR